MNEKTVIEFKKSIFKVELTENNTHISNSYAIKRGSDMKDFLNLLKEKYSNAELAINKLSMTSMIEEWKAHNVLCSLSFKTERTCEVDLNVGNSWLLKLGYKILSIFNFIC